MSEERWYIVVRFMCVSLTLLLTIAIHSLGELTELKPVAQGLLDDLKKEVL